MALAKALLPEFDYEMANTRKTLERVPEEKLDWAIHPKSMTFGALTTHLAQIPIWAVHALAGDSFDMAPPGKPAPRAEPVSSRQKALERFDKHVAEARAAIAGASDEELLAEWTLLSGGNAVTTLRRVAVIRSFVINHTIHHRAQLGVYLRVNDLPVPALYGPSADES